MEIYYIHIKSYNQFKNSDINFGGEFRFFYDQSLCELKIERNPNFIKDFFNASSEAGRPEKAVVRNISCVVGENGSGKTSLLNFIKYNLVRGISKIDYDCIFALKDDESKNIIYYTSPEITIDKNNCSEFGFELRELRNDAAFHNRSRYGPKSFIDRSIPDELRQLDFIYLSNVFDRNAEIELDGIVNLSTNFLSREDLKRNARQSLTQETSNEIDNHFIQDIYRQASFIHSYKNSKEHIDFDLPEILLVSIKPYHDFIINHVAEKRLDSEILKIENDYLKFIHIIISQAKISINLSKSSNDKKLIIYFANFLINFILELNSLFLSAPEYFHFRKEFLIVFSSFNFSKDFKKDIFNLLELLMKKRNLKDRNEAIVNYLNNLNEFFIHLDTLISDSKDNSIDYPSNSVIRIDSKGASIENFLKYYKLAFIFAAPLNFNWRGLSSGQIALLNLYSRLYSISDYETKVQDSRLKKNIFIMIDEADLYLHPSWSQKIVQSFINLTCDIFTSEDPNIIRNIQLVFSSNSPFILSDVPSSNVVFLKMKSTNETDKSGIELFGHSYNSLKEKKETFGANIHTLLLDSFFLPNGALSEFAKNKINEIIEKLQVNEPYKTKHEKVYIRKVIGIIGEPVIKQKLLQLFNDRFNIDIDDRVKKLESEIKKLKGKDDKNKTN